MVKEMEQKVGIEIKATTLNSYYATRKHLQAFISENHYTTDILSVRLKNTFWSACNITLSESWDIRKVIIVRWLCL